MVLVVFVVALMFAFALLTLDEMLPVVVLVGVLCLIGMVAGFWFFTSYIAHVVVSLALGRLMLFAGKTNRRILPFLAGLVVLVVLMNVPQLIDLPYASLIANGIVVIVGLGGLVLWFTGFRSHRTDG